MLRYIAWVWDGMDTAASAAAAALTVRIEAAGTLWSNTVRQTGLQVSYVAHPTMSSRSYRLHDGGGVVLGTIFRRPQSHSISSTCHCDFDQHDTEALVRSQGVALLESYWGRYVAFIHDRAHRITWVLRDPTGAMPCLSLMWRGVTLYFLELDDVLRLGIVPLTVNWDYLAVALCVTGGLQTRETGLREIDQVLGGERITYRAGRMSRGFCWDPLAIARQSLEDPVEATTAIRHTVTDAVHAWASCHTSVLHGLGGLDSSIVGTCLATAPSRPQVTSYTYFSTGAGSDERQFARLVAQRTGIALVEVACNPARDLEPLLRSMRGSVSPGNHLSFVEPALIEGNLAHEVGATAITSGFGGDQLFVQCRPMAAVDYAIRFGLSRKLWRIALDEARMDGGSVWSVLRDVLTHRILGRRWDFSSEFTRNRTLMSAEVIEAAQRSGRGLHPLMSRWKSEGSSAAHNLGAVGSGKAAQIHQLLYPPPLRNPLAPIDDPEFVAPLFSQPILELCLRIPTYVHTQRGQDRVLARRAFRDQLPPAVTNRWTKGGWEERAADLLEHNIRWIRGLLLDGELVKQRLLDQQRLEAWLSYRPTRLGTMNSEIFDFVFAEFWLQHMKAYSFSGVPAGVSVHTTELLQSTPQPSLGTPQCKIVNDPA